MPKTWELQGTFTMRPFRLLADWGRKVIQPRLFLLITPGIGHWLLSNWVREHWVTAPLPSLQATGVASPM